MPSMPGEMSGTSSTDGEMSGMPSQGEMPSTPGEMPGEAQAENGDTDDTATGEKEPYIRISGGTLTIINETGQDADGLDSNGSIYIDGGDIRISLLGDGTNNAIDYGSESGGECIVTGGTILAFGGSGMAEEFSENCTQCAVLYNIGSTVQAGTLFSVRDQEGEEIISYTPECSYSSVSFSLPEMEIGETYTLVCGENSGGKTAVVGSRLPNNWGLYDVSGNVWEWALDESRTNLSQATDVFKPIYTGGSWVRYRAGCAYTSAAVNHKASEGATQHGNNNAQTYKAGWIGFRVFYIAQ